MVSAPSAGVPPRPHRSPRQPVRHGNVSSSARRQKGAHPPVTGTARVTAAAAAAGRVPRCFRCPAARPASTALPSGPALRRPRPRHHRVRAGHGLRFGARSARAPRGQTRLRRFVFRLGAVPIGPCGGNGTTLRPPRDRAEPSGQNVPILRVTRIAPRLRTAPLLRLRGGARRLCGPQWPFRPEGTGRCGFAERYAGHRPGTACVGGGGGVCGERDGIRQPDAASGTWNQGRDAPCFGHPGWNDGDGVWRRRWDTVQRDDGGGRRDTTPQNVARRACC